MSAITPINLIYRSQTSGHVPSTLPYGQLAANVVDSKLWIGNLSNVPILLARVPIATTAVSTTTSIAPTSSIYYVFVTTSSTANMTMNLPSASTSANQIIIIKKVDASTGTVAITAAGIDLIDGFNIQTIGPTQYDVLCLVCDGTSWQVFNFD